MNVSKHSSVPIILGGMATATVFAVAIKTDLHFLPLLVMAAMALGIHRAERTAIIPAGAGIMVSACFVTEAIMNLIGSPSQIAQAVLISWALANALFGVTCAVILRSISAVRRSKAIGSIAEQTVNSNA